MATVVGRLAATLSLNSSAFNRGLKSAGTGLDRFKSVVGGVHGKLAALFTAAAGIGFTALIKNSFETIDAQAKLADRLGTTTEGLVALQHGASLAGVEASKLETGLTRLYRVTSDAASGNKEAQETFDALGLSAAELNKLPLEETLGKVADKLNEMKNPADKVRLSMELFGKSGAPLINFLKDGSKGIAEMRKEADRLGITFSRIDAKQVEEANDAISRLRQVFRGITNQIAIQLAPAVTVIARSFTEMGISGSKAGQSIGNSWLNAGEILARVADVIRDITIAFQGAQLGMAKFQRFLEGIDPTNKLFPKEAEERINALDARIKELSENINKRLIAPTFLDETKRLRAEIQSQIRGGAGASAPGSSGLGSKMQDRVPPLLLRGSKEQYKFLLPLIQPNPGVLGGWKQNPDQERNRRLQQIERYLGQLVAQGENNVQVGIA